MKMKTAPFRFSLKTLFMLVWIALATALPLAAAAQVDFFAKTPGVLVTSQGDRHVFLLEVARTEKQQALGLMYRRQLDADAGMLFEFDPPQEVAVWMKNTWIPLDILFVAEGGKIQKIVRQTQPFSLLQIPSDSEVLYVLEVNAGTADRLGLGVGDTLLVSPVK